MPGSRKPRTMRSKEILPRWYRLQKSVRVVEEAEIERAQELSNEPIEFFRQVVGFEPTEYQKQLIDMFLE
jgi:hypothetical protein